MSWCIKNKIKELFFYLVHNVYVWVKMVCFNRILRNDIGTRSKIESYIICCINIIYQYKSIQIFVYNSEIANLIGDNWSRKTKRRFFLPCFPELCKTKQKVLRHISEKNTSTELFRQFLVNKLPILRQNSIILSQWIKHEQIIIAIS